MSNLEDAASGINSATSPGRWVIAEPRQLIEHVGMKGIDRRGRDVNRIWQLVASHNDVRTVPAMGAVA